LIDVIVGNLEHFPFKTTDFLLIQCSKKKVFTTASGLKDKTLPC